jgi:hypothetical protein
MARRTAFVFSGGVDLAEPDGQGGYRFRHFFTDDDVFQPRQMVCDHQGIIWLTSSAGLYCFNPDSLVGNAKAYRMQQLNDQFYFSRAFKNYFGISPSQYRKSGIVPNEK